MSYRSLFLFFSVIYFAGSAQVITTVAGNGASTYAGDGGPAINASMSEPEGVAVDRKGNIFIVDEDNNVIRKVDTAGIIHTVAGTGTIGYSGNGGPATSATLTSPSSICLDNKGNFYIADTYNHAIRKVNAAGIITTVAGRGISGFGGDNGTATQAYLNLPEGVVVAPDGTMYICDSGNNRVRKVDTLGIITTIAGTGAAGYGGDNGLAAAAVLNYPSGITLDTVRGYIYVADESNSRVRRIDTLGVITTFAGGATPGNAGDGGPAAAAQLNTAEGIAIDTAGNVYISDTGNSRIRRVDTSGIIHPFAGSGTPGFSGDGGPAIAARLFTPPGIATDVTGNVYIAEYFNSRVRKVSVCAPPITISISGNDTICLGDSVTLHAAGASTFTWSAAADSLVADSVVVKPTVTTTYSVAGVAGPCAAVDSFVVVVMNCTSAMPNNSNTGFVIYPNPAGEYLFFETQYSSTCQVTDLAGHIIWQQKAEPGKSNIDVSLWNKGVYLFRFGGPDPGCKMFIKQ